MIVIFTVYIFSRIIKKHELSENIYNAKISTFTVTNYSWFKRTRTHDVDNHWNMQKGSFLIYIMFTIYLQFLS